MHESGASRAVAPQQCPDWCACSRRAKASACEHGLGNPRTRALNPGPPTQVWNLTNCKLRHNLAGHTGYINTVTVSPDGSLCASGGKVRSAPTLPCPNQCAGRLMGNPPLPQSRCAPPPPCHGAATYTPPCSLCWRSRPLGLELRHPTKQRRSLSWHGPSMVLVHTGTYPPSPAGPLGRPGETLRWVP